MTLTRVQASQSWLSVIYWMVLRDPGAEIKKGREYNLDCPKISESIMHRTPHAEMRWRGVCCMCQLPEWSPLRLVSWHLTLSESFHHLKIETGAVKKLWHLLNQNSLPVRQKVSMIGSIRGLGHYSLPFQINILTRWGWLMRRHTPHLIRDLSLKILS